MELKKQLGMDLRAALSSAEEGQDADDLVTGNQLQCVLDENTELGARVEVCTCVWRPTGGVGRSRS
jgi:hypothetical protein